PRRSSPQRVRRASTFPPPLPRSPEPVLATAAIGGIEAITVDVVVAQGGRNLLGDQKGINLAEIKDAGVSGVLLGGALGGAGRAAKAVGDAGGFKNAFGKMKLDGLGNFKNPLRDFEISLPNLGALALRWPARGLSVLLARPGAP
ncbi:hypothetical protein ACIGW8_37955, partial [Streptomyces sioyaensis]